MHADKHSLTLGQNICLRQRSTRSCHIYSCLFKCHKKAAPRAIVLMQRRAQCGFLLLWQTRHSFPCSFRPPDADTMNDFAQCNSSHRLSSQSLHACRTNCASHLIFMSSFITEQQSSRLQLYTVTDGSAREGRWATIHPAPASSRSRLCGCALLTLIPFIACRRPATHWHGLRLLQSRPLLRP